MFDRRVPLLLFCLFSCGCEAKLRSLEEIEADKRELPGIYFTEKTNKEVHAPEALGLHVDAETKELCYGAMECTNPACPGKSADGKPFLFAHRIAGVSVAADGTIVYQQTPAGMDYAAFAKSLGLQPMPTCPKCLTQRNLSAETVAQRNQYSTWVRPHTLPETAKRRAELEAEYQKVFQAIQKKRRGET